MAAPVITTEGRIVLETAMLLPFTTGFIKLFKNNITPNLSTLVADFTEADFTGYVKQTLSAPVGPFIDPINGGVSIKLGDHLFVTTSPLTVGNTIYGWWVEDASGNLIAAQAFDTPYVISAFPQAIPLSVTFNL